MVLVVVITLEDVPIPMVDPPARVAPSRIGDPAKVIVVFEPATSGTAVVVTALAAVGKAVRPIELSSTTNSATLPQDRFDLAPLASPKLTEGFEPLYSSVNSILDRTIFHIV